MPKDSEKAQRAREKKERKLLEAQIKQSNEKTIEARTILETVVKGQAQPNYQKAIAVLDQAIELHPENYEAFIMRGGARRDQFLLDEAIDDFTKATELFANAHSAFEGRAACFELLREYDKAIQDYSTVISIHPENDHAYNMRGAALLKKRPQGLLLKQADYQAVIADFKAALRLNENNFHARTNLGKAHSDQRNYREAVQCFTQALKTNDGYRYANYRRACANIALSSELARDEARYTNQLLARREKLGISHGSPVDSTAGASAGSPLNAAGSSALRSPRDTLSGSGANVAKKKMLLGQRVEMAGEDDNGQSPQEHISLEDKLFAVSEERRKCLASAVADLNKVIDKERKNLEITAVVHLANCYFEQGEYQAAEAEYKDALQLIPSTEEQLAANIANTQNFLNSTVASSGGGGGLNNTFSGTLNGTLLASTVAMGSVVMSAPLGDVTLLKQVIQAKLAQIEVRKEQAMHASLTNNPKEQ